LEAKQAAQLVWKLWSRKLDINLAYKLKLQFSRQT